jgi:outer membrane protein
MSFYPLSFLRKITQTFKALLLLVSLVLIAQISAHSQSTLTLQEATDFALKNAPSLKGASYDAQVAQLQTEELIGIGLPQVSASVQYQNYLDLPTSVVPGDFFGAPGQEIRLQFGTPHNMTAGISASQLLFNGSWLVGLQASKAYAELQNKNIRSSEIEIKEDVQQYYHLAAIAKKNVEVLSQTKAVITQLRDETNLLFKEGFVEEQDVEMLTLSISDLDNRINAATEQEKLTLNMLKFVIGMPVAQEVTISQTADELMGATALENAPFSAEANINVQLAENGLVLQELALKNEKAKLLPNAAAFYNLQTQALRQEFNFFDTSKPWFPIQLWGVQMNIPIFTGGSQAKSIEKAKVEVQRSKDILNTAKEGAFVAYQSAKISYDFALKNYDNAKQSLNLSQRILDKTNVKFKEGLSSSFEVSQSTTQVLQAQGTFIQALLNLLDAETALKKALNNL